MRSLRKLLLLAMMVIAALAFSASTATAQSVEMTNEATGEHCSDFTMDNHEPVDATCATQMTGQFGLYQHPGTSEILFSVCNTEFEAAFNEDGTGFIYNQVLAPEGSFCGREPCDEAEDPGAGELPHKNLAWPAQLSEGANALEFAYVFCMYAQNSDPASEGMAGTPCSVVLQVNTDGQHNYELTTDGGQAPCVNLGGIIEIDGRGLTGTTPNHPDNFEVVHR